MFKTILVAVDGSSHSDAAVEYTAYLAAEFGARIELVYVIDWRLLTGHFITHFDELLSSKEGESFTERVKHYYRRYGERVIERARSRANEFGASDVAAKIEIGKVAKHIIERAAQADLLAIGQRGEGSEEDVGFISTTTARVLHSINITALVAQPPMREFRRALLAYDGSAPARRAMEALVRLAIAFKLDVDVVHMIEPGKDMKCLNEASEYLSRYPIFYEAHYLEGDSHLAILEHAKRRECDVLAMGAYADRAVESLALGTTTEAMLGHSHIPVFVHR